MRKLLLLINALFAFPFIILVKIYQYTLSPDHGLLSIFFPHGVCRHTPTCSEYAEEQFKTRLLPIALHKTVIRILSCNPWTKPSDEKLRETIRHS